MSKIKIFQTSDIHGNIFPTNYVDFRNFGLAKVSTIIKENSKDVEDKLIIDSGDLIQGNSLAFYVEKFKDINPSIIECLNEIGYNTITFGNHEFNFGLKYLEDHYSKFRGDITSANVEGLNLDVKPYKIYEIENMKIAVVSFTTVFVPRWEKEENINGIAFNDIIDTYRTLEEELINQSDMIIVNYHGGFEKSVEDNKTNTEPDIGENIGSKLINEFDSIDILLTGHQHREICTKINNTVCMQPSFNGSKVTCITIDTKLKEITDYKLIDASEYDADPVILNKFKDLNERCNEYLDTTLTTLSKDITIKNVADARLNGHQFTAFIGDIFLNHMTADLVAISLFDSAIGFRDEVTVRQVNQNYPFPNTIVKIEITGSQIIEAITQSNNYYTLKDNEISINQDYIFPKLKHYNYDMFYGIDYEVYVYEDKNEIKNVMINNTHLELDKKYTMLVSNYRYNNISDYPVFKNVIKLDETTDDAIEIILNHLSSKTHIDVNYHSNYKIINTSML